MIKRQHINFNKKKTQNEEEEAKITQKRRREKKNTKKKPIGSTVKNECIDSVELCIPSKEGEETCSRISL